jgi:hypothetical protein
MPVDWLSDLELNKVLFIALIGLISGFVGTNTGGGALLSIPSLIFVGIPPDAAIATSRVASTGTMMAGIYKFHQGKKINYQIGIPAALFSSIGALIGASCLKYISPEFLKKSVGFVNLIILGVMILRNREFSGPDLGEKWTKRLGIALFLLTGFLGSLLAGQAIFTTYVLILFFGQTFTEAAGTRKIAGIATSIVSTIIYALTGVIDYRYGAILISTTSLSSYFGSTLGLRMGEQWMARLFYLVVLFSSLKLIF